VFWLALVHVNGHWLLEPEGKRSLGPEVDIPFTGEVGDGSSSASTHGTADERTFAAGRGHANQSAAASAAGDPAEVALLVVAASTERGRGAQIVGLAINLNSVEDQAKMRPARQVSRLSRINNEALDVSALWDDRPAVYVDRFGYRRLKVIAGPGLVACDRLVESKGLRSVQS
jgi:hypothetical protein